MINNEVGCAAHLAPTLLLKNFSSQKGQGCTFLVGFWLSDGKKIKTVQGDTIFLLFPPFTVLQGLKKTAVSLRSGPVLAPWYTVATHFSCAVKVF